MPGKKGLMSNKTKSKVAKTPKEKKQWVKARQIATKETGAKSEKSVPWGLVQKIYQDEKKSGKVIKEKEVKKTKYSKTAAAHAKTAAKSKSKSTTKPKKPTKSKTTTAKTKSTKPKTKKTTVRKKTTKTAKKPAVKNN